MLYFAPWKITLIVVACVAGFFFAVPNVLPQSARDALPDWLPAQTINLGLDLQGGSHLLLEVEVAQVYEDRLESLDGSIRDALRSRDAGERILHTRALRGEVLTVRVNDPAMRDEALRRIRDLSQPIGGGGFVGAPVGRDIAVEAIDATTVQVTLTEEQKSLLSRSTLTQAIEIVRKRIDELGTREPSIQRQGLDRIIVQVPGLDDPQRLKDLLGQTARMEFRLVGPESALADALQGRVPSGYTLAPSSDPVEPQVLVENRVRLTGERLVDAQPSFDQRTNEPSVTFRFDSQGARIFGNLSSQNVGRRFAILLDGQVISAPVIREPILQGNGQITGSFTVEGANDLAVLLRAGALPAPMTVVEERTVGAELGADSVAAGEFAALFGLAAVVVFMIACYGLFGIFANIALLTNIVLLLGALSALQATLTLPGIAGIVLTIGMAVDANVLIFERIREETAAGKSTINAIDAGYRRAMATILDANITTLIAAVILFYLGSGPVRGFSVTLGIGVVTSVFTAVVLCRLFVALWVRARRPQAVPL